MTDLEGLCEHLEVEGGKSVVNTNILIITTGPLAWAGENCQDFDIWLPLSEIVVVSSYIE